MISAGHLLPIGVALSTNSNFRIPEYQRNYNWERENVEDFWSDLLEAMNGDQDHFFGSLILEQVDGENGPKDIVDGQQRITTLLILIARLRDELTRTNPTGRVKMNGQEFSLVDDLNKFLGQHPDSIKYKANNLIREVFNDICKSPDHAYGEDKAKIKADYEGRSIRKNSKRDDASATLALRNNYFKIKVLVQEYLHSAVEGLEGDLRQDARLHEIYKIFKTATENFKVLPITTTSQRESLDVFLTTNDRGLDLGVMDLVRGQILEAELSGVSSSQDRREILERHSEILQSISSSVGTTNQIDAFLRHWLHLRPETVLEDSKTKTLSYQRLTMRKVPDFTKSIVGKGGGAASRAGELWTFIQRGAEIYGRIDSPQDNNLMSNKTRLQLLALKSVATSYRIFALRTFDEDLGLGKKDREALVDVLLKYVFKWVISGGNAQDMESFLHKQSHLLRGTKQVAEVLRSFEREISNVSLEDEELQSVTSDSWARGILYALEADAVGTGGILSSYHVEHIAPQSSTKSWMNNLGVDNSRDYKQLISEIGNLTLLDGPINTEIQQAEFSIKRKFFKDSNSALAKAVSSGFERWTHAEIAQRSNELRQRLKDLLE